MPTFAQDLQEKKRAFLFEETGVRYTPPSPDIGDPEKYYWPKVIARFERFGDKDSIANRFIRQFADRSPFHFTLVGMARIMNRYPDAPALKSRKTTILRRVFDRKDSYNCWTAEGTENHINMSRTSGYLFAQVALDENFETELARMHLAEMKGWVLEWSKLIFSRGTGEWNSGIYGLYNLIGWLNLYDFAKDPEVKAAARAVCDYYAAESALYYSWGVNGGAEMRGNGVGHNLGTSGSYLAWFWYSDQPSFNPEWGREYIQVVHAATSSYKPNAALTDLARKKLSSPFSTQIQMPDYLITRPGFCRNSFFVSDQFTLGSSASSYGGWTGSTSQIVTWKWVGKPATGNEPPFQVSGNGMYYMDNHGKIRDPFTQVLQNGNVLFQLTRFPVRLAAIEKEITSIVKDWSQLWRKDFEIRFPEEKWKTSVIKPIKGKSRKSASFLILDQRGRVSLEQGVYFVEFPGSYLAIRSIHQDYPQSVKELRRENKKRDDFQTFDWVSDQSAPGTLCGFVLEAGDFNTHGNFERFKASVRQTKLHKPDPAKPLLVRYTDTKGRVLEAEFVAEGTFEEAIVDWGYGVKNQQTHITSAPFVQPRWPDGDGHGKVGTLKINGDEKKPSDSVFDGPVLELKNGNLRLHLNGKSFESNL